MDWQLCFALSPEAGDMNSIALCLGICGIGIASVKLIVQDPDVEDRMTSVYNHWGLSTDSPTVPCKSRILFYTWVWMLHLTTDIWY